MSNSLIDNDTVAGSGVAVTMSANDDLTVAAGVQVGRWLIGGDRSDGRWR